MRKGVNVSLIAGFASVLVLALACKHYRVAAHQPVVVGPRTLTEVIKLAERLQLYSRSDTEDGAVIGKVFLSERPLSYETTQTMCVHAPDQRTWLGTVAICLDGDGLYGLNYDPEFPERTALWGSLFLYGDPVLIRQLMEQAETPRS